MDLRDDGHVAFYWPLRARIRRVVSRQAAHHRSCGGGKSASGRRFAEEMLELALAQSRADGVHHDPLIETGWSIRIAEMMQRDQTPLEIETGRARRTRIGVGCVADPGVVDRLH